MSALLITNHAGIVMLGIHREGGPITEGNLLVVADNSNPASGVQQGKEAE
jgi:hypothetical protein